MTEREEQEAELRGIRELIVAADGWGNNAVEAVNPPKFITLGRAIAANDLLMAISLNHGPLMRALKVSEQALSTMISPTLEVVPK